MTMVGKFIADALKGARPTAEIKKDVEELMKRFAPYRN